MKSIGFWSLAIIGVGVGFVLVGSGLGVSAQGAGEDYKIGVIDMDVVVENYERRKDEVAAVQSTFDEREMALQQELETLRTRRLELQQSSPNPNARFEQSLSLDDDVHELQQQLSKLQADKGRAGERLELILRRDIHFAIDALGSEENYHMLFQRSNDGGNDLVYISPTVNATSKLIDRLNQQYQASQ